MNSWFGSVESAWVYGLLAVVVASAVWVVYLVVDGLTHGGCRGRCSSFRGPFVPSRDTDPAVCERCGRLATLGDLHVVYDGRTTHERVCGECSADLMKGEGQ